MLDLLSAFLIRHNRWKKAKYDTQYIGRNATQLFMLSIFTIFISGIKLNKKLSKLIFITNRRVLNLTHLFPMHSFSIS